MKKYLALAAIVGGAIIITVLVTLAFAGDDAHKSDTAAAATATPVATPEDTDGDGVPDSDDGAPFDANTTEESGTTNDTDSGSLDYDLDDPDAEMEEEDPSATRTTKSIGRWGEDDGLRFKVTALHEVQSIPAADDYSSGVIDKRGSKLVRADVTVKNDMPGAVDPLCGGPDGFVLLDQDDRNFQPIDNALKINNNVCDDGIQPGFKASYVLAYRLPAGSKIDGLAVWNSEDDEDSDGSISYLVFE